MRISLHHWPLRLSTGAFILHSGLEKWTAGVEQTAGLQAAAAQAFPRLGQLPPRRFGKLLAAGEIATGAALLVPVVPAALAGAALTVFSGGLLTYYVRAPGLRRPGSVWPTPQGIGVSKDVWMLGAGLSLLLDRG